jgi:hydroxymethylpyrimidine/phosphomethylpyrimidine kinase
VLTISCSDSSGRSGIQADLKALAALGVHGLTAVTVVTAQNTRGIQRVHDVPPRFVAAQIDAVARDGGVDAVKTGMLGSWQMVAAVAERVRRRRLPNLVVDPAMVSGCGGRGGGAPTHSADGPPPDTRLLGARAAELLRRRLLPLARLVTPDVREAEWLTGKPVRDPAGMRAAAEALAATGVGAVLIRGGDLPGTPLDLFYEKGVAHELAPLAAPGPRLQEPGGEAAGRPASSEPGARLLEPGAGAKRPDRLTAALAARLALGEELRDALVFARAFVTEE